MEYKKLFSQIVYRIFRTFLKKYLYSKMMTNKMQKFPYTTLQDEQVETLFQTLFCIFMILVIENTVFAIDSTNFNPVPIEVKAKSIGGVPVGTIVAWPVAANPEDMDKWLEWNGQPVNPTVYPEPFALIGGNTPDFRNNFLNSASGNVGTASLYRLGI